MVMVGTAQTIADQMGKWLLERVCDAFNIMFTYPPMGLDDFVDQVIPELQHRGIFRKKMRINICARIWDYGNQSVVMQRINPHAKNVDRYTTEIRSNQCLETNKI